MHKPQQKKPSISRPLILWICAGLIVISAGMAVIDYLLAIRPLKQQMQERVNDLCRRFALVLAEPLWKLDASAIDDYFSRYAPPQDLAAVRVYSEFGDAVFARGFGDDADCAVQKTPVRYKGGTIGSVEVSLSMSALREAQRTAFQATVFFGLAGVLCVLVLVSLVLRVGLQQPVNRLLAELKAIAHGEYRRTPPEARYAELEAIFREVGTMAEQIGRATDELRAEVERRKHAQAELMQFTDHLEELVAERTRQLMLTNDKLRHEIEERRKVQAEIVAVSMAEQQRFARDLHDGIGQQLIGIMYLCQALVRKLETNRSGEAGMASGALAQVRTAVDEAQRIARGLAPVDLAAEGLPVALEKLASDVRRLQNTDCRLEVEGEHRIEDVTVATHLFYIAREAVNNAVRHGHPERVTLRLRVSPSRGFLAVTDDGAGLVKERLDGRGMGFRTMRYRAEACGGKLSVIRRNGRGVVILAAFRNRAPGGAAPAREV